MKALVANEYGGPDRLVVAELSVPEPGPGQIQVRIAATTVNPTDLRVITGGFKEFVDLEFPYVPGNDFAGTVTEVGPDVTQFAVGDEVFGQGLPRQLAVGAGTERPSLSTGAMAEYAVFEADTPMLAKRPDSVPPEQAAALAIGGWTAIGMMRLAEVREGETVFLIGGLGGVGTVLIPLLAKANARVIATARTTADAEALRGLGVAETVGYDPAEYPSGVDLVFNLALYADALPPAARALRPGGRLVSIVFPEPTLEQLGRDDVELHFLWDPAGEKLPMDEVGQAAADGTLVATIQRRYPLEQAVDAVVAYGARGVRGNIVVTP